MGAGTIGIGKETRGLQHEIDPELTPGQIGRIALGQNADSLAIDDQIVAIGLDLTGETAVCRVVFEQVR